MPRVANPDRKPHPKDPDGFSISARFPREVFHEIQQLAAKDQRSLNFIVNKLVEKGLTILDP